MVLGDARAGKLADNLIGFGRMLRRAGLPIDSARISLAQQALGMVDLGRKSDVEAALRAVLVSRQEDQHVFVDLFEAYFRNPEIAKQLMAQLLPQAKAENKPPARSARAQEALQAPSKPHQQKSPPKEEKIELDAAMSASDRARLRHADFNQLSASEFKLIERLVREIPLALPTIDARRRQFGSHGDHLHWRRLMQFAARHDGDFLSLPMSKRRRVALPLLVLVDVSGSMERYARLMLAFLHQALYHRTRDVFAFGTQLTDLNAAFAERDTDVMLAMANQAIADFGGGTQLGAALKKIREDHRHDIIGNRTLVLLITDGLDTGDHDSLAQELDWLTRQARATVWLNPLLRYDGYQPLAGGAQVLDRYVDKMLAIHNLEHLSTLASSLAKLMKQIR
ncbi:MAG: VWA domain-containing protein [Burkholderiaceae bacterium]|nr:VWA domain-containing protein [Burkholderiaceae bacterium]MCD8516927.1 VWA domain-containing protein [Burkholderiaceae bacterium]MCD8537554.1 VWA domain-containing protein [Burkholderiaceae bacterium]MCD8565635.1 VWA domain-containing protein [Burkholderiaceae bacterium]